MLEIRCLKAAKAGEVILILFKLLFSMSVK